MTSLGIIGLGLMGQAFAIKLREAGFEVLGYDCDPSRCLGVNGPEEVAHGCERILLSLPNSEVVKQVLQSLPLRAGQIILDTSTGDPADAAQLGAELRERGVMYLDATISGSSAQVLRGEVTAMVGGDEHAYKQCSDIFSSFARDTIHTGVCGTGAKMKLVTNLVLGLNRAALAEGLAFAKEIGVSSEKALEALTRSMAYSRIMDTKGPKMITGDFSLQHLKDVRLILAASSKELPLSEAHRALLEKAEALGFGDLDNSAILRAYD